MASPSFDVDDPHLQNYIRKVVYEATGESLLNLLVPEGLDRNLVMNWRKDSQRGREVDLREAGRHCMLQLLSEPKRLLVLLLY